MVLRYKLNQPDLDSTKLKESYKLAWFSTLANHRLDVFFIFGIDTFDKLSGPFVFGRTLCPLSFPNCINLMGGSLCHVRH